MKKVISAIASAVLAASALTAVYSGSALAEESAPFGNITGFYITMVKSPEAVFEGNKALVIREMVCKDYEPPCVFDEYEWEVTGTADAAVESGIVYDEECSANAVGYAVITANSPGVMKVTAYYIDSTTKERLDYMPEVIWLVVDEDGNFEEKTYIRPPYDGTVEGDINGDGAFTIADVVTIYRFVMGKTAVLPERWKAADLCPDGVLNTYDLVALRKKLAELDLDPSIEYTAESVRSSTWIPGKECILCTTLEELEAVTDYEEQQGYFSRHDTPEAYDEAFFENNSLIYVRLSENSGSNKQTVKNVRKKADGAYTVEIESFRPMMGTCDMALWEHYITVPKSESGTVSLEYIVNQEAFQMYAE